MMYNYDRRPSDLDSASSSVTSDVTSRATTIQNSWSATTLQEKLRQLSQYNIRPIDDDQSSVSTDMTAQETTVIQMNNDAQRNHSNSSNDNNTVNQQQQQQQPWINPYWGVNSNSETTTTQSETNHTSDSSPQKHVKQLIPGSILINDQGEIDDALWKKNAGINSSTSSASFNPGGEYVSDENGGGGGFLAPTHIQRRAVPSSSSGQTVQSGNVSLSNQPPSSSSTTSTPSTQPWINPYWPQSNQNNDDHIQTNDSKQNAGNKSPVYINTSPKATRSTDFWQQSHWVDNNTSNQNRLPTESASSPPKILPVPFFYERIYPPPAPSSSPTNKKSGVTHSIRKSEAHIHDDDENASDDLPYTFDSPNVVRYRAGPPSPPNMRNKNVNINSTLTAAPYPMSSTAKSNFSQYASTTISMTPSFSTNILPTLFPNRSEYSPSVLQYNIPSLSNSITILTEEEIHSIHDALRLLQTNPNAIPVIETSNHIKSSPSPTINHQSNPFSSFTPSSRAQSSISSRNVQFNIQQTPAFSMPSYPGTTRKSLQQLTKQGKVVLI
ncbi:hypothetical protein I4U23_001007 [Adineta vaga]|nr:hypothetical protein I4U23_001007 [Adineta vaga]